MKKMILVLMVVGLLGVMAGMAQAQSTDSANVNLLVTPVVSVQLSVSPTYYDFGSVAVGISTCSVTALTLSNDGTVGLTVEKAVWADDDWRIDYSSTTQDGFGLWAMTNASQPGQASFTTGNNHDFDNVLGDSGFDELMNSGGTNVSLNPAATGELWFRLDMPASTGNTDEQTIQVRLKGISQ